MDHLSSLRTGRDIRHAFATMPATLNESYVRMLQRIREPDRFFARQALLWLCFALRPLLLDEVAEAAVLRESDRHLDADCRINPPTAILDICQGLVHTSRDWDLSGTDGSSFSALEFLAGARPTFVTLAHDSIRSFLTSDFIKSSSVREFYLDPSLAHAEIMRKCLSYVRFEAFAHGPAASLGALRTRYRAHPLVAYASHYWPIHSEGSPLSPGDEAAILAFFATKAGRPSGSSFASWVQFLLESSDLESIQGTEPLYYAASFNMRSVLRLLLRDPAVRAGIDEPGGRFRTPPLVVAVWRGNDDAAEMLIEAGADVGAFDVGIGMSVYDMAKDMEMWRVVELMEKSRA
jgi:hypothetical protein